MTINSALLLRLGALVGAAKLAAAECPNACSGRGTCGAYDMCTCYNGYMANDCSERICPFGLAHVDSPKGDLNMDNNLEYKTVIPGSQMYKDGTSELFPIMKTSNGIQLTQSAHYYTECSNKGLCDRTVGTCACFVGYEGNACQRTTCPNSCSGHGVCKTIRELAAFDYDNVYELWDADVGLACDCDAGYGSHDCSERLCPYGIDPFFVDDDNTARVSTWTVHFEDAAGIDGTEGSWRFHFYDVYSEDWVTEPISINATCNEVVEELERIPNGVISEGTVECTQRGSNALNTLVSAYELKFTGNPGNLKVPEILVMDEVGRHTLKKSGATTFSGLDTMVVYDSGVTGEFYDYFGSKCGVTISVSDMSTAHYGAVQTATVRSGTERALKTCLGDSNGISWDNVGVENWDYGAVTGPWDAWSTIEAFPDQFPHLVKLVDSAAASEYEGGVYAIMFWDTDDETFYLGSAVDTSMTYQVFATDGVLERVWYDTDTDGKFDLEGDEMGLAYWTQYGSTVYASRDFSCENAGTQASSEVFYSDESYLHNNCLEKGDLLVFPATTTGVSTKNVTGDIKLGTTLSHALSTPNSAGLYEIKKISMEDYTAYTNATEDRFQIVLDRPLFWDGSTTTKTILADMTSMGIRQFYRFTPDMDSNTNKWVAPCSNRGLCDLTTGLCSCFAGYTNENCDTQSALAV